MYLLKGSTLNQFKYYLIMSVECLKHNKIKFRVYYYSLSSFQLSEKCYLDRIVLALSPRSYDIKTKNNKNY